ncbi:NAD(P)-dependent alcohol dehydrogenase [Kribbella capetownensis]|uniref:NAD(P)-dependent alcohol dehydrogenase n=1 Tax=Kribbella capetownensis TaxID=1572659 RepID=A0A4R0J3F7_9ACTN|nr:NAD(P)-dependent alcohol dehydrogenase [Kribbella capetownensis]TCC39980.1 NAD(P)-dependent alcohol dehydrogenase [Kribbella capetownensis]
MLAITQTTYGETDVLELRDIGKPAIAADEVLIRVRAAGVDRGVWHVMAGLPYPVRLAGYGVRAPKNQVLGMDVAGIVEAVGADVTRFQPGDEVFGVGKGAFAEYTAAFERKLAPKPANLTFEQAAVVPISGMTALQGVRDQGEVASGQQVLVTGASGGVGSYAVQLAKAFGAEVTGVSGASKMDLVRSLGADHVVDYRRDDFAAGPQRYDVILDIAGNASLSRLRRALTPKGTVVIMGGENGGRWLGGTDRQMRAVVLSPFVSQRLRTFINSEKAQHLLDLTPLLESGAVVPPIDQRFPLSEVPKAIQYLLDGHARGKVVITLP